MNRFIVGSHRLPANHPLDGLAEELAIYAVLLFFCISGYLSVGNLARHQDMRRFAGPRSGGNFL